MKENSIRRVVRRNLALGLLILMVSNVIFGDQLIRLKNGETARITNAPNGTPMIELANPNQRGISVNNFESLSVDERNLILNNISKTDGSIYRSELGGLITPNENYTGDPAKAILIRVSNDPSIINGFIEAASVRNVDFFMSNSNGIYLNGGLAGRFGNVVFTTGKIDDNLTTIMVRNGRIEIGANGFNAKTAENLGIMAREIAINGQLNSNNELSVIAGEYDYDINNKNITKQGNNPGEVLISASVAGSVYSRQIYLVAVGSDLGVKGDVIGDRVSINADGSISVNRVQGTNGIDVKGKNFTQEGSLYTENNLTIDAEQTTLNGTGTQAKSINISGKLNNNTNIYASDNLTIGSDTVNKGKMITEKSLTINGSVDSDNLIYAKDEVRIAGTLNNKNELQSENNISIGGDTTNSGKVVTSKKLDINGKLDNTGTVYAEESIKTGNLNNSGSIQSKGDITAGDTRNDGKILTESNLNIKNLENSKEIITGKQITVNNIENKTGAKLSSGEKITANGNVVNHGTVKVNEDFNVSGDLQNNSELAVGGDLNTKAITNTGNLKTAGKITGRGVFTNSGEILTSNLDVETTGSITNTNKISVIENSKLKASNINNGGVLTSNKNIEIITTSLTNTGNILADEKILINNTNLNNTGTIASNDKIELNNSNIINRSKIESSTIDLLNLSSYDNNAGTIRGNNITLSTSGNLNLEGTLLGINNLFISGLDLVNNGKLNSAGVLNLTGRDITNNTDKAISGSTVNLIASGNILNNGLIEGEEGTLKGQNITNTDLIMFLDDLTIEGTKLTNTNASIYSDKDLTIKTGDVDNTSGEIVGQNNLNILNFNLLDNSKGIIDSRGNIFLSGNKLLNGGEVSGQYRLYWTTWDGRDIYEDTWRNLDDDYMQNDGKVFTGTLYDVMSGTWIPQYTNWTFSALNDWRFSDGASAPQNWGINPKNELTKINNEQEYKLYYGNLTSGQLNPDKDYRTQVLTGYVDTSQLVTSGGRILSGGNLTLDVVELENINSKISAGGTLLITNKVQNIKNETTAQTIKVYDGEERVVTYQTMWTNGSGNSIFGDAIGVGRDLYSTTRDINIADSVSVIEGNNVVIQGTPTISNGYVIQTGATVNPATITTKDVDVDLYYDPVSVQVDTTQIAAVVRDGVIPFNFSMFNDAISKLFTQSKDPSSKYLIETRSQYIDLSKFYGSDYFLGRLGYNEANEWNLARRLGDSYYETKYLNSVILETLGTRFINGKADTALIKELLDNGVETSKNLQLSLGIELTKEQVAALKSDIIWYVEKEVNGEKVLVPQVYLSQATLDTIKNPTTTISAQETLVMNSGDLLNQGRIEGKAVYVNAGNVINKSVGDLRAEILGDNVLITSEKDILNIGATIGAKENLNLIATGDIVNITTGDKTKITDRLEGRERVFEADSIQSAGVISVGETAYISGNNYISRGAITEAGDTVYIEAENEVKISTINLKESQWEKINYGHESYEINEKVGSEVTGVGNVVIDAKDINIKGSSVMSDGMVQMTAENDINIVNDKDTMYTETIKNKKGTFSSYSLEEKDYKEGAVASTIVGNNVILDAGNNINVRASNVIALKDPENMGGNILATAGNDINILADTLNNEYSRKEKSSGFSANLSAGGGGVTAGVSYNKNSMEQTSNNTVVAVSTLMAEGNMILDAGNRVKTEAMQANIGEDLIIRGVNGVDLLDAQETYEDKMKQKSSSIGITANFAFTPAQIVSTVNDVVGNVKDYGFDNSSQTINTIGNGIQDIRNVTSLTGNLYEGIKAGSQYLNGVNSGLNKDVLSNAKQDALSNLISADISLSYNQSSSQSNTRGTTSVAGVINVGGNMIVESEGDVKFVNQKITVGDNIIINAKNFEALAGENTYTNTTKSNSAGISAGYDIVNNVGIGGVNVSAGNSNTTSKTYDNTTINAGGTFQLTTTEDATFKGANVTADKINFDIGKNLNIISLQDEYKSHGESAGVGINVSGQIPGTTVERGYALPSFGGNYSQDNADSKWVSNQTSIIANNRGSIKVNETLTNIGAIVGSLSEDNKLSIDAKKLVTEDLKDYNKGENYGIDVSGIGKDTWVPQTGVQYGSHDKEQNTNATFANTEITENGVKLDLEKLGINTDITKAQVVTKDEVVEQIDTVIHTDLINTTTRNQVMEDILKTGALVPEIAQGIKEGLNNPGETVLGQISNNMAERSDEIKAFVEGRDKKLEKDLEKYKNDDGKVRPDEEVQKIIADSLRKTLDEFGKGDYAIVFVVGDPGKSVSIDDTHGVMYVNIAGNGFGNPEEMRKNVQHDGGHGTYHDRGIDETAADRLGNKDKVLTPSNAVIDADIIEKLKSGTEAYNKARENGDIQDKTTIGGEVSKNKANIIGKQIPEEKKGVVYTFDMIEKTINSTFSTDININRDKYNSDPNYRDKINYYYFQAENHLKDSTVLATGTSNGITQIAVKTKDGKTVSLSEIPQTEAVFHNIHYNKDGTFYIEYNSSSVYRKFVSEDGHELIMSKDLKTVIKDPTVYGTYNYYTYGSDIGGTYDKVQHLTDINLWKEYGSGPDDWTTKAQRLKANTLAEKLSNAPIVSDKNFKDWLVKNNITRVTEKTFEQYKNRK